MHAEPINPQPLEAALRAILRRAIPLAFAAIAALGKDLHAIARLKDRLTRLVFLTIELIRRLPQLAAGVLKKPRKPAKECEERLERVESLERLTETARPLKIVLAQIIRELGLLANNFSHEARIELATLAVAAQRAAEAWTRPTPEPPKDDAPSPIAESPRATSTPPNPHDPATPPTPPPPPTQHRSSA